jgi:hypothetical protein
MAQVQALKSLEQGSMLFSSDRKCMICIDCWETTTAVCSTWRISRRISDAPQRSADTATENAKLRCHALGKTKRTDPVFRRFTEKMHERQPCCLLIFGVLMQTRGLTNSALVLHQH